MLPGEQLKHELQRRNTLPSISALSAALPTLPSASSAPTPRPARTAKQRKSLREREVDQLKAVLQYGAYRSNPLQVMQQHLQTVMESHRAETAEEEKQRRWAASKEEKRKRQAARLLTA